MTTNQRFVATLDGINSIAETGTRILGNVIAARDAWRGNVPTNERYAEGTAADRTNRPNRNGQLRNGNPMDDPSEADGSNRDRINNMLLVGGAVVLAIGAMLALRK